MRATAGRAFPLATFTLPQTKARHNPQSLNLSNFPAFPPSYVAGAVLMAVFLRLTQPRPDDATAVSRDDAKAVKNERG